uniref:NADH-ubiquinone oxidoreductase chain 4L n=1 Tax=Chaetoderma nitidulum TaxID=256131 RepID=D3G6D2_CHANT|nr:NADH dehydrogenase subunit 4L [Chaetoderma nitidulum]ABM69280.1 NADH dehydrogenase subunit 4L [Chaetoderma nitidulum]
MFELLFSVGMVMIFVSMMTLSTQSKHLLNCLLSLEMALLGGIFIMMLLFVVMLFDFLFPFLLLAFGASEASLGLALLVLVLRSQGNDFMLSSMYKC